MEPEKINWKDEAIDYLNIYVLFDLLGHKKVFHKILQLLFFKEISIFNKLLTNNISCFKSNCFELKVKKLNLD